MLATTIRSRTKLCAKGKKLYKFVNALRSANVRCSGQYCRRGVFYCEIASSDLKEAERLAGELGVELSSREYESLSGKLRRYRLRIGLILGALLAIFVAVRFSRVVATIEIQGNSSVSDEEILSALSELGVRRGVPLKDIDFHVVGNELRVMVDDISWASLRHTGNRVVVEVTEIREKPEMFDERSPCNLVAARDAEITYVSVLDGQLMRKVGDFVPAGTLLVSGVTGDATGHIVLHRAMGEIRGIYYDEPEFFQSRVKEEYVPTGEKREENYLRILDVELPLFAGGGRPENYEKETSESSLKLFGKELPVGTRRETYSETELRETEYSDERMRELLMEKIFLYEKNFLSGDVRILDRELTESFGEEGLTIKAKYRVEGDVCERREIIAKPE